MSVRIGRISKQKDFEKIFKQGKSFQNNLFSLRLINNELASFHLAVVVSNKISKKAVVRNRLRRQAKEILRKELFGNAKGFDLIFIAKGELAGSEFPKIKDAIINLLNKAKII